jgi:hypothetical protein
MTVSLFVFPRSAAGCGGLAQPGAVLGISARRTRRRVSTSSYLIDLLITH